MTILGTVYYDNYEQKHRMPGWVRSERYEFCDGFYSGYAGEKQNFFQKLAESLKAIF